MLISILFISVLFHVYLTIICWIFVVSKTGKFAFASKNNQLGIISIDLPEVIVW